MNVMKSITEWLAWMATMAIIIFALSGLHQCDLNGSKALQNGNKVETVLVHHTDTITKLDTILKTRIKYIDTSRIDTVHDILDSLIPIDTANNDSNQVIAANQLREAVKWKDSLNTCLDMHKVDSATLDSVAKATPDTIKITPSVFDRVKDFGAGFLVGAGIRSFF